MKLYHEIKLNNAKYHSCLKSYCLELSNLFLLTLPSICTPHAALSKLYNDHFDNILIHVISFSVATESRDKPTAVLLQMLLLIFSSPLF